MDDGLFGPYGSAIPKNKNDGKIDQDLDDEFKLDGDGNNYIMNKYQKDKMLKAKSHFPAGRREDSLDEYGDHADEVEGLRQQLAGLKKALMEKDAKIHEEESQITQLKTKELQNKKKIRDLQDEVKSLKSKSPSKGLGMNKLKS